MRDAIESMWSRVRMSPQWLRWGIALAAATGIAAAGALWLMGRGGDVPPTQARYVEAQRALHATEALVHLDVLRNAVASDRRSEDLEAQIRLVERDLGWSLRERAADAWSQIEPAFDRLRDQIRTQDPHALETLEEIRRMLVEALGRSG